MVTQKVTKWGNSLGIRLPEAIIQQLGLREGETIEIITKENQIILSSAKPKYSLDELLKEAKPQQQHEEINWGEAVGEENW